MAPRPPVMPTRTPKKRLGPERRLICGGGEIVFMAGLLFVRAEEVTTIRGNRYDQDKALKGCLGAIDLSSRFPWFVGVCLEKLPAVFL